MEDEKRDEILDRLSDFHGHLGPYVVIGYRMGRVANREIGEDPFEKEALAMTGRNPPLSCIVDGIQLSSGCTLGKGNMEVNGGDEPSVEFSGDGRSLKITLKKEITKLIAKTDEEEMEEVSDRLFRMPEEEIFEVNGTGEEQ